MPTVTPRVVAVLAGSRQEFDQYVTAHPDADTLYVYVYDFYSVDRGRFDDVVRIGSFYHRYDAPEIAKAAHTRLKGRT